MKEQKGKFTIVVLILVIMALICFNGYLLYDKLNNNNNNDIGDDTNYLTIVEGHRVQIENKDAKIIETNDDYVLYYDKSLMLYNIRNKSIERIDIEYDENLSFNIIIDAVPYIAYYDERCFDVEPKLENNSGIYNVNTKKIAFKNQYSYYSSAYNVEDSKWRSGYAVAYEYNKTKEGYTAKVINLEEMKVAVSYDYSCGPCNEVVVKSHSFWKESESVDADVILIYTGNSCGEPNTRDNYVIYDNQGKVIDKLKDNEDIGFSSFESGDLTIYKYAKDSSSKIFDSTK